MKIYESTWQQLTLGGPQLLQLSDIYFSTFRCFFKAIWSMNLSEGQLKPKDGIVLVLMELGSGLLCFIYHDYTFLGSLCQLKEAEIQCLYNLIPMNLSPPHFSTFFKTDFPGTSCFLHISANRTNWSQLATQIIGFFCACVNQLCLWILLRFSIQQRHSGRRPQCPEATQ